MPITEIFPKPLVKQVIFEARYPSLFFMEDKIGDIQLKLFDQGYFTDAKIIHRKGIIFADIGPDANVDVVKDEEKLKTKKIWQFTNEEGVRLNILDNKFDIVSTKHKTYNLGTENKFRDCIELVLKIFLSVINLPKFTRIGLRYIDEGPIFEKTNESFLSCYNSTLPLDTFPLDKAIEMGFATRSKRRNYYIIYREEIRKSKDENYILLMDFDGYAENIKSNECLNITDELRNIISDEFMDKIKDPIYKYMREEL
jgi:uncharacterized protein (TIGR04255 family)